ncbi:hypothetical protein QBC35DRAFT_492004 [Podospora australis]|uniref:Secreted protein n=1 Tax=Podospora australis TaxID=1536484 RepID=A0AAN7AKX8_9PEZI|nr:hypothetical protein QBC35DRAFT_492004 [Podospora australis]
MWLIMTDIQTALWCSFLVPASSSVRLVRSPLAEGTDIHICGWIGEVEPRTLVMIVRDLICCRPSLILYMGYMVS